MAKMELLEKKFGLFLNNKGICLVTQKNYLSDLRHFLSWLTFFLKSKKISVDETNPLLLTSFIDEKLVSRYKNFLSLNRVCQKTANRRLSTLRKFCSFCISQGWLNSNPAKKVVNIGKKENPVEKTLTKFKLSLKSEGVSKVTIKNYLSDIRQFLTWAEGVN